MNHNFNIDKEKMDIMNKDMIDRLKFMQTPVFLKEAFFIGAASVAAGYSLRLFFQDQNKSKSNPIFYFLIGAGAHSLLEISGGYNYLKG